MKCTCKTCAGAGTVLCDECHGAGETVTSLQFATIDPCHPNAHALLALQDDIFRIERAAAHLMEIKPNRAESYVAQRDKAIAEVEAAAEKADREGGRP